MSGRLLLVAHAGTVRTRELPFGDDSEVRHGGRIEELTGAVARWLRAPGRPCRTTVDLLGGDVNTLPEPALAEADFGTWTGRVFAEVAAADPEGLRAWLSDPRAAPHGGESLADLVDRVGGFCDDRDWPPGRTVAVVPPLVARAAAVHALAAPPEVLFRLDVAPLGRVGLSRNGPGWRLQLLA